ncbi:MAG: hypothetical protein AAGJ73_12920 [Pseudomonadota bacterium]
MKTALTIIQLICCVILAGAQAHAAALTGWIKTQATAPQPATDAAGAFAYPNTAAARRLGHAAPNPIENNLAKNALDDASFDVAPAQIDFPETYETALERDVRQAMNAWRAAKMGSGAPEEDGHAEKFILSIDVKVASEYWAPSKWRSPVFIAHADTASDDALRSIGLPGRFSDVTLGVDTGANDVKGAPRLTIRMILVRDGARVWTGYAGAPVAGASRSQIARALTHALADRMGATVDDPSFAFNPVGAAVVRVGGSINPEPQKE